MHEQKKNKIGESCRSGDEVEEELSRSMVLRGLGSEIEVRRRH